MKKNDKAILCSPRLPGWQYELCQIVKVLTDASQYDYTIVIRKPDPYYFKVFANELELVK